MTPERPPAAARVAGALTTALIVVLPALRPLIGDTFRADGLEGAWRALVLLACAVVLVESWCGARRTWRWGPAGLAAAAALAVLAPAALRSPLGFDGFARWGTWAIHLLYAGWLMQAVQGRAHLLAGALLAGLAGESAFALGQWTWALPAMAERIGSGAGGGLPFDAFPIDLRERIEHGGVFGTFLQANALGAFLALTVPLAVGIGLRRDARGLHLAGMAAAGAGLFVWSLTDSKGAWVATAAAVAVTVVASTRGRRRVAVLAAGAALAVVVLAVPRARHALAASAEVRLDYWRGALALVGERPLAGHGVGGFEVGFARVMPLTAEYARQVHDEPLEAAVDGGLAAGAAVAVLLLALTARRRGAAASEAREPPPPRGPVERWIPALLVVAVPYAQLAGLLDLSDWPGGAGALGEMGWALAIGAAMAAACALGRGVAPPGPAAVRLALIAFALHCLVDFDLHLGGLLGTVAAVACLGSRGRPLRIGAAARTAATAVVLAAAVAGVLGWRRAAGLRDADRMVELARAARTWSDHGSPDRERAVKALAAAVGGSPQAPLATLIAEARQRALATCVRAPRAPADLELGALGLWPAGEERLARSRAAVAAHPGSAHARQLLADDLRAVGAWDDAVAAMEAAIARSPAYIPYRLRLADLLRAAARRQPGRADQLDRRAAEVEAEARALEPRVHPANRAR